MSIYTTFVTESQLISPVNGYKCKRLTKKNINNFGFSSIENLQLEYPNFPLICSQYKNSIGKDPRGLKCDGINKRSLFLREEKENRNKVEEAEYNIAPKKCEGCSKNISFTKRNNRFCSMPCSNKREWSIEHRLKLSKTNTKDHTKLCKHCDVSFISKKRKFCSDDCMKSYKRKDRQPLVNYRSDCAFKFNIYDFPEEFDLSLLDEYGWYRASNRGNNLNGISRDHMVSVRYGFDHGIDPKILSHPANCQLLQHKKNISKHSNCSLSLENLMTRILEWNKKYGGECGILTHLISEVQAR